MDIIKSESAKQILARSYDGGHICYENAESAVEVAEKDMKQKAIEAFRRFTEDYCLESGRTDISNDSEHYVKVFNELIDE
jgi:predicted HAD superfamily phosphohydrolase